MKLYQAQLADIHKLAPLYVMYRQERHIHSEIETIEDFLHERLARNDIVIFYTETGQGEVTGFVQLNPMFSAVELKRIWLLYDLYAKEEVRSQVTEHLLARARQLSEETHSGLIMLHSHSAEGAHNPALTDHLRYIRNTVMYAHGAKADDAQDGDSGNDKPAE